MTVEEKIAAIPPQARVDLSRSGLYLPQIEWILHALKEHGCVAVIGYNKHEGPSLLEIGAYLANIGLSKKDGKKDIA